MGNGRFTNVAVLESSQLVVDEFDGIFEEPPKLIPLRLNVRSCSSTNSPFLVVNIFNGVGCCYHRLLSIDSMEERGT